MSEGRRVEWEGKGKGKGRGISVGVYGGVYGGVSGVDGCQRWVEREMMGDVVVLLTLPSPCYLGFL